MRNWLKIILGILLTIFLGAIGSGLWERFLSKFVDLLVNFSIEFLNTIFKSYKDGIYETASLGFHEYHSVQLFLLLFLLLPIPYLYLLKIHPESKIRDNIIDRKLGEFVNRKYGLIFIKLLIVTVIISCLFLASKTSYTNRVITYSMRSIDIIKPVISTVEHSKLISQFYQVRNTDDYNAFNKSIKDIAAENSLKLPENAPLE